MSLRDFLRRATGRVPAPAANAAEIEPFAVDIDEEGVNFRLPVEDLRALRGGAVAGPAREQLIAFDILCEQGHASTLPNGYMLESDAAVRIEHELAAVIGLPPRFPGRLLTKVTGQTTSTRFAVTPMLEIEGVRVGVRRTGPVVEAGGEEYLLSPSALSALEAIDHHRSLPLESRGESENVALVASIQAAQEWAKSDSPEFADPGFAPSLGALDSFRTVTPERVGVLVEPQDDGSLELTPDVGVEASADAFSARQHHLEAGRVIRIDQDLVLLSEEQREAVREITRKRRIPAESAADFLRAPGDFFESDAVDVEISFGIRVKGIGAIVPVTFGEASKSLIEWLPTIENLTSPVDACESFTRHEQVEDFAEQARTAWDAGTTTVAFNGRVIDISDPEAVEASIRSARKRIAAAERTEAEEPTSTPPDRAVTIGMVIEESVDDAQVLRSEARAAISSHEPDLTGLRLRPLAHQHEGIRWIAGLLAAASEPASPSPALAGTRPRLQGALLADDMGLGKTFMTLTALRDSIRRSHRSGHPPKPALAVLPLSLIENWEAEIGKAFDESPFTDVVVLQTDRDLRRFRIRGAARETTVEESALDADGMVDIDSLQLALRVGEPHGSARLDTPGRLVIATYQTLAGFQLSLGQVDWGAVVFDEAQTIKNPDTLASRAAKGLRADFKLLATGTPVENSLKDFWNLMDTAQPGLLGGWQEFRRTWVPKPDADPAAVADRGRALREQVGPFMLRRTKEDVLDGLPSKTVHVGWTTPDDAADTSVVLDDRLGRTMPPAQLAAYDEVLERHAASRGGMLQTLQSLRSVSLHPHAGAAHGGALDPADSARFHALSDVLNGVRERGEKAIVFVIDKSVQRHLSQWLQDRFRLPQVRIVNGETPAVSRSGRRSAAQSRKEIIEEFEAVDGFNVVIMSPLAVGTGFTVTAANHAIHLERHWNPAKEAQATDRIHRIGQTRPVHVYLLIALHPELVSFDVNLDALLRSKSDLKDAIVIPENVEEAMVRRMSLDVGH